jgi:DNA gyrase/topoisomerase IV subunit A
MSTIEDKRAELAKLKALTSQVEASRAAQDEEKALDAEIAQAARQLADTKALAEAERTLGKKCIGTYPTERGLVIVKRPNHLIYRRFADAGNMDTATCEELIRPCLVHPSREMFEAYAEELPGIIVPITQLLNTLAGFGRAGTAGK